MNIRKPLTAAVAALALLTVGACSSDADRASRNLSTAAENFEIERRVIFVNGITDEYILEITGRCSVETENSAAEGSVEVTCKIGPDEYKKHYLGLSDNVTFMVEQLDPIDVSLYNYRVIFKPQNLVPSIELSTGEE